jgi:hypothetical protein
MSPRNKAACISGSLGLFTLWLATVPAQAQNRGVYPLGMTATNSGVTPDAGFTYANQLLFYARDEAKDDDGNTLLVTGKQAVIMDMNTLIWVSKKKVFAGARCSVSATFPIAKNNLTSDVTQSGGGGFADSYYLPVILAWDGARWAVRGMYGFLAPTGRFEAGADDNVGSGYWTHTVSSGQTFYLTENRRLVFSAFEIYEFHTDQEGTDVHPGDTFDLDYSLMGTLSATESLRAQAGVVGYEARQTTAKTGPGVNEEQEDERYAVNAVGVAFLAGFPRQRINSGLKYFHEFANRSTFQGYSFQLFGAISF